VGTTDLRRLATIAIVAIAGCAAPVASSGPPASPQVSCLGVPAAKCEEAVASVARSLPNSAPVSIEVSCVSGTCTSASGAMDTFVTLADGSQLRSATLSWNDGSQGQGGPLASAPPVAAPTLSVPPRCIGVPAANCQSLAQSSMADVGGRIVAQIVIRCSNKGCTDKHGEGETVVTFADGTTRTINWGYAGS